MSKNSSFPKYPIKRMHPQIKHSAKLLGEANEPYVDMAGYAVQNDASVYECAALARDVYYAANDTQRPTLPNGWVRYMDSSKFVNPYFGACYLKETPAKVVVVYAHRGTVPTVIGTVLNALEIAEQTLPGQISCAGKFIEAVSQSLENKFNNEKREVSFINVGHSLGGVLSDLVTTSLFPNCPSITFENPGSKKIITDYRIKQAQADGVPAYEINAGIKEMEYGMPFQMHAYQGNVNLINSCNAQSGKAFRLDLPYKLERSASQMRVMSDKPLENFNYIDYTFEQHQIDLICDYLKSGKQIVRVNQPVGFNQGYAEYLNYEARKPYWDEYQKKIWEGSQYIRNLFKDDEDSFRQEFIKTLADFRHHNLNLQSSFVRPKLDHNALYPNKHYATNAQSHINNKYDLTPQQKEAFTKFFNLFKRTPKAAVKSSDTLPEQINKPEVKSI